MGFFLLYLVNASVARASRQYLILLCELHFAVLYLLQLDSISAQLADHVEMLKPILSLLGRFLKVPITHLHSLMLGGTRGASPLSQNYAR